MIVESDSTKVVDLYLNRKCSKTEISWTIAEIQASLKSHSPSLVQYVPRGCNAFAHSLAKVALEFQNLVLWLEIFLDQITMLFLKFV